MLDELIVRNLAVLAEARLEPGRGFTVITGETGTGKTLLVGALEILGGAEMRGDAVGAEGDEASVEARFVDADGTERIVSRRRTRTGRTRSYLDGHMAAADDLRTALDGLVDVVAQHDHLRVARPAEAIRVLDVALDDAGLGARAAYLSAWDRLAELRAQRAALGGDHRALARERDFLAREAGEIAAAAFTDAEVDALRSHVDLLRNGRELLEVLGAVHEDLTQAEEVTGRALDSLRRAARLAAALEDVEVALAGTSVELAERRSEVLAAVDEISLDPDELEQTERRLATFGDLRRRFGETASVIADHGRSAATRAAELGELLERASTIDDDLTAAAAEVRVLGEHLTDARRAAGQRLAAEAEGHLKALGFTDPVLVFEFEARGEPGATGTDRVELRFASDRSLTPGPIGKVASGGELSRIVLALRLAQGVGSAPVTAFDEIDAGVGGATALALGERLAALAGSSQVLCVTHLPQVAAFGDTHFLVERVPGGARVRRVEGAARVAELTRMLSGIDDSDAGRSHAEELLRFAADRRHGEPAGS